MQIQKIVYTSLLLHNMTASYNLIVLDFWIKYVIE